MFDRDKTNANRLAAILNRYSEDSNIVEKLSAILNYNPKQLQEDMKSIRDYIRRFEEQEE